MQQAKKLLYCGQDGNYMKGDKFMTNYKMELLSEKIIAENYWYPNALFSKEGIIAVGLSGRNDLPSKTIYSTDGGENWHECTNNIIDGVYKQLKDGSIIGLKYHNAIQDKIRKDQKVKPFIAWMKRADSISDFVQGKYSDDFSKIKIPDLDGGEGDAQNYCVGFIDHGLVELENGDIIITMYGKFRQDNIQIPYFPAGAYQYRTWVCISKDKGDSWEYLSTVASNEIFKLPERSEGYCEADLLILNDNKLLTVMRTGGNPCNYGSQERYTPMFASFSDDAGKTWDMPKPIYKYGVWPRLIKTSSGKIICLSGRPGVFMLISDDDGKTWSEPYIITDYDYQWGKCSSGYGSIKEIEPGVIAVLYDDIINENGNVKNVTKIRKYSFT